eukprot:CAMPEP_0204829316 /NCGR_PEP_ID=MMETSP1346-20131115/7424_1 /ASSEMBLY_ACC=CAM_ASM_000771 /TAXON_ID=215587 /ORGANISM="Aplanochytrium stocchinoi, Strain GSBS06" /LENGTH=387 /DNA_ID=CAMNT_0051959003 /DNA_START=128 /DNA_END=1288 /DNA_ORIENTATION=-
MEGKITRAEELPVVKFGSSDMMVTRVCAGTMTWGSMNGEEKEAHNQLDALIELGVNFFDTAELYPVAFNYGKLTEQWIGNWMKTKLENSTFQRGDIYIATKCNPAGVGAPKKGKHGYDAATLMSSCKASLERLQCEYIDLYQLHWPCRDVPVFGPATYQNIRDGRESAVNKGELETFDQQVLSVKALLDAGLIKHWGLSNENAYGITMFCLTCDRLGVPRPISVQNDFSMNNRVFEGDTLEACYRFGLVGLPYGNLSGGVLTGKYDMPPYPYEKDRSLSISRHSKHPNFQSRYMNPMARKAARKYAAIAEKYGMTPTELALAWSNSRWYNAAVIIGTTTVRQVKECVKAFKITLPDELLREVEEVHEEFRNPSAIYAEASIAKNALW